METSHTLESIESMDHGLHGTQVEEISIQTVHPTWSMNMDGKFEDDKVPACRPWFQGPSTNPDPWYLRPLTSRFL